jgi:transposase
LLALGDWLSSKGITHVAMESTGEYWKPVYNLLESGFEVLVVNAQHIKNVPGRKTDVKDAEWLAQPLRHGLLRGSFIPPLPQRDLRDLTRSRTNLVRERVTVVNRLQKVLEWANIKLAAVVSDVNGVSAHRILAAIVNGIEDSRRLADLAHGSLQQK